MDKIKAKFAENYGKTWDEILKDFEFGMGVSKMFDEIEMMEIMVKKYLPSVKQLEKLERSIVSADPTGEDTVIKDLKKQINKITSAIKQFHQS